jgi:hypothetical protein
VTGSRNVEPSGSDTAPEATPERKLLRARTGRQLVVGLFAVFLVLGVLGFFGSKTSTVSATSGGYSLSVVYPAVTRPGLPIRWVMEVRHPGGFAGPIHLATSFGYLHLFDTSNTEPAASSSTADGGYIVMTFDPPKGDVFTVTFDSSTEVGVHEFPPATTAVLVDGVPVVQVHYDTKVVP